MTSNREQGRGSNVARRPSSSMSQQSGFAGQGFAGGPFGLMRQLSDDMDRLFEQFGFGRALTSHGGGASDLADFSAQMPEVDMFRRGDEIVVRADLPGLSKNDVQVDIEDDVLRIRGERQDESGSNERENVYWNERRYGAFERDIPLPEGANADQAKATFRDGVLEVTVPAPKQQGQHGHQVQIQ